LLLFGESFPVVVAYLSFIAPNTSLSIVASYLLLLLLLLLFVVVALKYVQA
jgi:hypothetical protein